MIKSMPLRTGRSELGHPDEVLAVHERILVSPAQGRDIKVGSGRRVHVIEAGKGPPVVLLHGSSTSSLLLLPLLERLKGLRGDRRRPAGVHERPRRRFPRALPRRCSRVPGRGFLDELELDTLALAGNSMGGTWALWYALARPDRVRQLVLLGAALLLPGTRVPPPLRVMATSVVGELLLLDQTQPEAGRSDDDLDGREGHHQLPGPDRGARRGGQRPGRLRGQPRRARAAISPFGFRRPLRVRPDELRQLTVPTLLVWGDHDPIGAVKVAEATANQFPNAQLEVLHAGHAPWLGNPDRTAKLVSTFVR